MTEAIGLALLSVLTKGRAPWEVARERRVEGDHRSNERPRAKEARARAMTREGKAAREGKEAREIKEARES